MTPLLFRQMLDTLSEVQDRLQDELQQLPPADLADPATDRCMCELAQSC